MNIDVNKLKVELIKPNNNTRRSVPLVTVGHNRIGFNKEATSMIKLDSDYKYAEVSQGERNNEIILLFRFLRNRTENSFVVGNDHSGRIYISNKELATSIFGAPASRDTKRLDRIEIDSDKKLLLLTI